MIYLTNGNMPLNAAYADEIVQEDNSTYQLSFRFPTSDPLWEKLKEETFLTADDLHGEQDFVIFEVEKKHGYIQVYANQVFTLLNNYVVNPISLDRQTGSTALSRFAGSITRDNPFSFFSDIEDRHTFNIGSKNAMEAFAKDKHSIIGQWGGDLVRHGYQVRLLKNGGSENESLFMYKKNLSSYQHKTSTKSLKTRITFITTVKGEGEKAPDRTFTVTIDSPLINKYSQIYEDVIEVNDQDVKDEASLRKYGEQYYRTSLCDMMEDSLEIEVVGRSDVPVQMYDIVSLFHEVYNLDVRKKITKYIYSPMAKKLKSIGFGQFQSGLANAIGNAVSDAVKGEAQQLQSNFEQQLVRELKNADLDFDRKKEELVNQFQDGMSAAYSKAEEVRMEILDTIDQRFSNFDNGPLQEVNRRAEEALQNAGASSLLALKAKQIGLDSIAKLEEFRRQTFNTQSALSVAIDALKRTVTNEIQPKQAQSEAEIAKQVEALIQTKNELAGVKSAQATYEETTTRRLSELTNLASGKASKSELTQTAEELASKITSVQIAHKNQGDRVSVVESNFRQRADALDAGVSRLTEGLRTKADISSLNVTAENIRQSVKRLETDTQNKLNQKLNQAEFEVQAGSIRQEILNATKDKADKTLVVAEAGKLREEFSKMKVGSRNYAEDYDFSRGLWLYSQGDSSPSDWRISNGEYNVKGMTKTYKQMQIHSKEGSRSSWKSSTALLELEVGETYTLSFQGICYSGSPKVWVSLRANRTVPGNPEIINGNFNLTPSWQTYQVTIPALTKPDDFDFWRIILGYNEIGHVAFRKVELTRSSTRIDAGPAPEDGKTDLVVAKSEFQKTAEGLSAKLATVETYVSQDGQRQEVLRRYTREESARQASTVRELVTRNYVGKATYQEDVREIESRFEGITNPQNGSIATQIANYKKSVDGRFTDISSLLSGKANQTDFQRVQETSKLYERILGSNENDISNKVARMALTNQLFQIEVSKNEGLKTVQRQIAGSWAVQNINNEGDLISGINLGANGYNRFDGKLTHITGETLIDKAVIKSAMVDKLKTANFEAGSVTTVVLDAEAVTAEKLKVDQAFFNKLVANEAYLSQLFAKQAFINRVQSVAIDASQVRSGILSGDRIYGGTIRGAEINGTRITGDSRITIGGNGFLRPTEYGGLQINVPETFNASKGIGVQLLGRNFGEFPKGMFIYNAPNWNGGNLIGESVSDTLLTVKGLTSLCNLFNGKPMSGLPINSNFRFGEPVPGVFRVSFIAWDPRYGQLMVNDGTNTKGTWWFKPDPSSSDKRLKVNIQDTDFEAIDFVKKLEFKQFDWKPDKFGYKKPYTNVGLIAQDVEKLDSSLVYSQGENLALDDFRLGNIALKAIQELSQRIETLERKLA